jgi:Na+/H+ antiporter NhaD/arsenite permease-like protein
LTIAVSSAVFSAFIVHPSKAYLKYVDYKVLACLFCLMAVVSGLRKTGVLELASSAMTRFAPSVRRMSFILIGTTFFVSMAITNDVALITLVPISLIMLKDIHNRQSLYTIITLQTIAANIGSSLTPIGNPQNLYLYTFYQMDASRFFLSIFPMVLCGGILIIAGIFTLKKEKIIPRHGSSGANQTPDIKMICIYLALFIIAVLAVFRVLDYRLAAGVVLLAVIIFDLHILAKIDYSLLLTFVGFFIFIGNLQRIGPVNQFLTSIVEQNVLLVSALASQIISNVPAAMLLSRFTDDSASLLRGVSLGGMGTIIASLASVISFKSLVKSYPGCVFGYLKVFTFWNVFFFLVLYFFSIPVW